LDESDFEGPAVFAMLPQIYKFKELLQPGDAGLRFVVLEDRGDWVIGIRKLPCSMTGPFRH